MLNTTYFNLRFLGQPFSGMQRVAEELLTALDDLISSDPELLGEMKLIGLEPKGQARPTDWVNIERRKVGSVGGHLWEQMVLPVAARGGLLVSLGGAGPILHPAQIVLLADANVFVNPAFFSKRYVLLHRNLRPLIARRAARLITISEFSRRELARYCSVPEEKFSVIPDSAEHITKVKPDFEVFRRSGVSPGKYVLCVGNQSPNKNITFAAEAFARADPEGFTLVVAGSAPKVLRSADLPISEKQILLGRVTDPELRALYENAAAFLFPSIYEGFGLPPLEAMSLGCPVISSDSSAMPEVLRDGAKFYRAGDVESCAATLREILGLDASRREELIDRGYAVAASYSWQSSAERLALILKSALGF